MARKYVYGIIPTSDGPTFDVSGLAPKPQQVYTVVYRGLGCVVSNYLGEDFNSLSGENLFRYLMAHQAVIERVRKDYPILPLKFGTLLRCDSEVQCLIEQGHRKFAEALIRLDSKAEGAPRARVAGCLAWGEADEVLATDTLDSGPTDEKVYG